MAPYFTNSTTMYVSKQDPSFIHGLSVIIYENVIVATNCHGCLVDGLPQCLKLGIQGVSTCFVSGNFTKST